MYYYVYKLTFEDGYYYIGAHSSKYKVDTSYVCSSRKVLEKADTMFYRREILCYCDSIDELADKEIEYINDNIKDIYCLNKQKHLKYGNWIKRRYIINPDGSYNVPEEFFKDQYKNIIR